MAQIKIELSLDTVEDKEDIQHIIDMIRVLNTNLSTKEDKEDV